MYNFLQKRGKNYDTLIIVYIALLSMLPTGQNFFLTRRIKIDFSLPNNFTYLVIGRISNRLTHTSFPFNLCIYGAIHCSIKSHCNVTSGPAPLHDRIPGELAQRAVGIFLGAISIPGWLAILTSTQKYCTTHNHIPRNPNQCMLSSTSH